MSVPVLSTQSMSTWLSDSTALACWTSAPTPGHAHGRQGVGDGDGDEEAVGDEAHEDRGLDDGLVERHVEEHVLDDEQQLQVQDDDQRHADDGLDLALQRGQRAAERPRARS